MMSTITTDVVSGNSTNGTNLNPIFDTTSLNNITAPVEQKRPGLIISNPESLGPNCPFHTLINTWVSYCKEDGLAEKTIKDYEDKSHKFLWWWQKFYAHSYGSHPQNVTTQHARSFAVYLRESATERWGKAVVRNIQKLSAESIAAYGRTVKAFFNWLEREKHIERNPFNRSVRFRSRHKTDQTIKTVTKSELIKILRFLTEPLRLETFVGKRDLAILKLLIDTGMRRGELLSITVGRMNLSNQYCKVTGKCGKREIPFSQLCRETLESYQAECIRLFGVEEKSNAGSSKIVDGEKIVSRTLGKNTAFWLTAEGEPLTYYGFSSIIRRINEGCGVDFHAHELRHTYATVMIQQGVSLVDLKDLMGHTSVTTTELYIHQDTQRLAKVQEPHSPLLWLREQEELVS